MNWYPESSPNRYSLAVILCILALITRLAMDGYVNNMLPFITFYFAVTVTAFFVGPGPAALATVISFIMALWFFIEPRQSLYLQEISPLVGSLSFLVLCLLIIAIGTASWKTKSRVEASAREAESRRRQAEAESAERQKTEETLRQTLERLAQAERIAMVMPLHVSLDGCWLKVTPTFCLFLGYDREEDLIGRPFKDFTHPADFEAAWNQVLRLRNGEIKSFQMEKRFMRKDGSFIWGYLNCSIVSDEQGQPVHLLTYVLDINEKKLVEEELHYKVATLNLAVESTGIGTFDFYPEIGEFRWSEMTRRHFGMAADAPVDYGIFLQGIHPDDRAKVDQLVRYALEQESSLSTEFRTIGLHDGRERWVSMRGMVFYDEQGGPLRLIGTILDMSERKKTEEDLRRTLAELSRSNLELAQFAYVASHDLQEPLRMIVSYMQLLANRYAGRLDEKADSYIQFAVDGAKRMQKLIHGLLDYARITRGADFHPVSTTKIVAEALANLDAAIKESGAVIEIADLPTVFGDEIQLLQLFQNIISNALKYRKPTVPPKVRIAAHKQQSEWLFSATDNGIGIETEHFDRIFEIFQRLHGREEYSGTGIGLALCKRIVERHGGKMWVESIFGEGSTFFFTLPATKGIPKR